MYCPKNVHEQKVNSKGEVIRTEVKPRLGKPLTGILADKTGHTKTQTGGAPGTESMVLPIGPTKSTPPSLHIGMPGEDFLLLRVDAPPVRVT